MTDEYIIKKYDFYLDHLHSLLTFSKLNTSYLELF